MSASINKKYPIGTSTFHADFVFKLFYVFIAVANSRSSNNICNSLLFLPQAGKIYQNRMIRTTQNLDFFDIKPVYYVSHFWLVPF